jgi:hypothetical protein
MANKFLTAVTNEGAQKILYNGGGWNLTPYAYVISEKDVLSEIRFENLIPLDEIGNLTDEAEQALQELTYITVEDDSLKWYQAPFEYITRADDTTLTFRILIPSKAVSEVKQIKTIYFLFKNPNNNDEIFLFAVAYAKELIEYQVNSKNEGLMTSFFFTFTVDKSVLAKTHPFNIDYTYPDTIETHSNSTSNLIHPSLLRKNASQNITGTLVYSGTRDFTDAPSSAIISKEYIDGLINQLKEDNNLT